MCSGRDVKSAFTSDLSSQPIVDSSLSPSFADLQQDAPDQDGSREEIAATTGEKVGEEVESTTAESDGPKPSEGPAKESIEEVEGKEQAEGEQSGNEEREETPPSREEAETKETSEPGEGDAQRALVLFVKSASREKPR